MLVFAATLAILGRPEVPEVRWVDPPENAWRELDLDSLTSLPCELEWDDQPLGPDAVLEYQIGTLDDSAPWIPFENGPLESSPDSGIRRVRNVISGLGGQPSLDFIRARLRLRARRGRSTAAFMVRRGWNHGQPWLRYVGRTLRVRSDGPLDHVLSFPVELSEGERLTRVEYRYRRSETPPGPWRHAGDYAPGKQNVNVDGKDFPKNVRPGESLKIDFRAYNGESYSKELASADIAVNNRPGIESETSVKGPISVEAGQAVALPFAVSDKDGDQVTVLFRIDDDVTWSVLPMSSQPNVIPGELIYRALSTPGVHTLAVTAFDGLEDSEAPVVYSLDSWLKDGQLKG